MATSRHAVVMTFPAENIAQYGFCIRGFRDCWPLSVQGLAIVEGAETLSYLERENLQVIEFDDVIGSKVRNFAQRNSQRSISDHSINGNIAFQAEKFARKAFAQLYALDVLDAQYVHYIDADLLTLRPINEVFLDELVDNKDFLVACTPRWWQKPKQATRENFRDHLHVGYTETGYIIWNKQHNLFDKWVAHYQGCYDNDVIFEFSEWHDCIAFDYATFSCKADTDTEVLDLAFGKRSHHPLVSGPLGKYFDHMKGKRKFAGVSSERMGAHGTFLQKQLYKINKLYQLISKLAAKISKALD